MNKKPRIKVVKKDELSRVADLAAAPTIIPTEEDSAKTMTKTVTGWVRDFKRKGVGETGKLMGAFGKATRPSEA